MKRIFKLFLTLIVLALGVGVSAGADEYRQPQYLMVTNGKYLIGVWEGVHQPSGWDIDRRGGTVSQTNNSCITLNDTSEEYPIIMTHAVGKRTGEQLTYECKLQFADACDGFELYLGSREKNAVEFGTENGWLVYRDGQKGSVRILRIDEGSWYRLKAVADFERKAVELSVGGTLAGSFSFTGDTDEISLVGLATPDKEEMTVSIGYMCVYENYLINEGFYSGEFPYDWECEAMDEGAVSVDPVGNEYKPLNLTVSDKSIIDNTVVRKVFERSAGKIICEFRYLGDDKNTGVRFSLKDGERTAAELGIVKGELTDVNGRGLVGVTSRMWHIIRFEADTAAKTALVKYDGRRLATIPFTEDCAYIDRLELSTGIKGKVTYKIRDVMAYVEQDTPTDYLSAPLRPDDGSGKIVCMQSCDLWDEQGIGWDPITAYSNRIPYLGWYDETKSEVTDWEIKWMAEHGVDVLLKCWYLPEGNYTGEPVEPVKATSAMNAFYNCKYSDDYMKYGLIVCSYPAKNNPQGHWREAIVPYWIEQCFSDERYIVVDNKPVIFMFGWETLIRNFGSEEKVKAELDYLRGECRRAGFDGAYLVAYCPQTADGGAAMTSAKNSGFDYTFVYTWGSSSYKAAHQTEGMQRQRDMRVLDAIPNISMGYHPGAWHIKPEVPYASDEAYTQVAEFIKNDLMPQYEESSLAAKMVTLDNWNEWGEGHFVSPSSLNGFGYLDVIRKVFSGGGEHKDETPTDAQKSRFAGRYDQNRTWLRYIEPQNPVYPTKVKAGWYFDNEKDCAMWQIEKQVDALDMSGGALHGKTTGADGGIVVTGDLKIDISNSPYIKIRMKTDNAENMGEVFFTTEENNGWTQLQAARYEADAAGEYADYYFKMSDCAYWHGTLNKLRFDMSSSEGVEFSIRSIEILENDRVPVSLYIDGVKQEYKGECVVKDGTIYIPTWPHMGYQDALHAAVIYNNAAKTVTFTHSDAEIVFTLGSDIAVINGVEQKLAGPVETVNNLPNLPIRLIAEAMGDTVSWNSEANAVEIITKEAQREPEEVYDISSRVPNQWEFEVKDDLEGWVCNTQYHYSRIKVRDGVLTLKSKSNDPIMTHTVDIDAKEYKTIKICAKNLSESTKMQVFFASSVTGGIDGTKVVTSSVSAKDEDFTEYTFDMSSNENWQGTITNLRIDPIDSTGTILIDYIRVEE